MVRYLGMLDMWIFLVKFKKDIIVKFVSMRGNIMWKNWSCKPICVIFAYYYYVCSAVSLKLRYIIIGIIRML